MVLRRFLLHNGLRALNGTKSATDGVGFCAVEGAAVLVTGSTAEEEVHGRRRKVSKGEHGAGNNERAASTVEGPSETRNYEVRHGIFRVSRYARVDHIGLIIGKEEPGKKRKEDAAKAKKQVRTVRTLLDTARRKRVAAPTTCGGQVVLQVAGSGRRSRRRSLGACDGPCGGAIFFLSFSRRRKKKEK